VKEKQRKVMGY